MSNAFLAARFKLFPPISNYFIVPSKFIVRAIRFPWISICLLFLANIAFGLFLHDREISIVTWWLAIADIILEFGIISIAWNYVRKLILLCFTSDVGYSVMAVAGASIAVIIVAWVQISGYFLVMLAAALLLRVDLFTRRIGTVFSFIALLVISLLGLTASWIPIAISAGSVLR